MPSIDEIYVEVKLIRDQVKKDLEKMQDDAEQKVKQIENKLKFKARFDGSLVKLNIDQLKAYREKLQGVFEKKLTANVDTSSINRTKEQLKSVDEQLKTTGEQTKTFSTTTKGMGGAIMQAVIALGVIKKAFDTLKASFQASLESARTIASINQALRTTGDAAGFTTEQLKGLAEQLQQTTGVEDTVILKNVTRQLLNFSTISGDIFKRTQEAIVDMAGGSAEQLASSTMLLGKALENPMRGMLQLERAGIRLDTEQKRLIASFVQTGNVAEAQEIILGAVEKRFKGQAEEISKAELGLNKMHSAWQGVLASLGDYITQSSVGSFIIENFTGGLMKISKWLQGSGYEVKMFKRQLDDLKSNSANQTLEILKGSSQKFRDELRKWNAEEITANNLKIESLKEQIKIETQSIRLSDSKLNSLKEQLKILQMNNQVAQGEVDAIDKYEEKIKRAREQWTEQGKTVQQIKDRISDLTSLVDSLEPADPVSKDAINQIIKLQKLLPQIGEDTKQVRDIFKEVQESIKKNGDEIKQIDKLLKSIKDTPQNIELIATLKLRKEELEALEKERKIKLGLEITDIDFDAGSIDESELTKQIEGTILSSVEAQQKANDERGKVIDKFYSSTKNKDEEYVKWRLRKIAEETLAIQEATGDQILAKKYQVEQQKELEDDYFEYSINKWREQNKTASIAISVMTDAFAEGLQLIQVRTKENASVLEKIFVEMANAFIRQVARMIAEWMAFQTLKGIAATLLAPVTGGASLAAAALQEGGEVVRGKKVKSYSQIPKFATGTEFNVPAKYTNDSFLMRVSANERVRVTPANRVGDTDRLLNGIQNSLDVLNKNLINKDFAPVINTRLDIDGRRIARQINSITERMQKEGQ